MTRTCSADIPAFVSHSVPLPRCCPVSGNPAPGSTLRVSYLPKGIVLPVEDLTAWVREFVDGHPSGIREMETMIQDLARQTAAAVGVPVRAVADLKIDPPIAGDRQTMRVTARGGPTTIPSNPLDTNPMETAPMSETKHTPGPWQAVRSNPAEGADVWWIVGNTASHNQEKDIGSVQGGCSSTHEADASLIAAAPDLLAVVRRGRQKLATYTSVYTGDKELRELLIAWDAAIDKATGASA